MNPRPRPLHVFGCLMLVLAGAATAWAGQPLRVFIPDDGSVQTTNDDKAKVVQLRWYEGAQVKYYVVENEVSQEHYIIAPAQNANNLQKIDIMEAINRALLTWNGARWGSFQFVEGVGTNANAPYLGPSQYHPRRPSLDGFNIITMIDTQVIVTGQVGATRLSFFRRDFDPEPLLQYPNMPLELLNIVDAGYAPAGFVLAADFDSDLQFDLFLPFRKYKAGELIDADIVVDTAATPYLRTWPESSDDVPAGERSLVAGSLDVQGVFTHLFGSARGIANSLLVDASMDPFFEGPFSALPWREDPYRRRILSFDDQLAVGVADGNDFGGSAGLISGQVLEGSLVGAVAATGVDVPAVDELVVQAPVYLLARPEAIEESDVLSGGRPSVPPSGSSPALGDDVVSQPFPPPPATGGTWRKIAQVLSGQNLVISAGQGNTFFVPLPTPDGQTAPVNPPENQPGGSTGTAPGTPTIVDEMLNSQFYFPGLPSVTDGGTSIAYAVRLENNVTGIITDEVFDYFTASRGETYTDEFFGGPNAQIQAGNGQLTEDIVTNDQFFGNGYISAQISTSGHLGARIVGATALLSGMGAASDPHSYVRVISDDVQYDNRFGTIGIPVEGLQIDDQNLRSTVTWQRSGKFSLRMQVSISSQGGIIGIPAGLLVSYTLTNLGSEPTTFSLQQVLDSYLFGSENPVYTVDGLPVERAITLQGTDIPREVHYQTSLFEPSFTGFLTLRGFGLRTPDQVTIAGLADLHRIFPAGQGYPIRGLQAVTADSGVGLTWKDISLQFAEARTLSFIVGFLPVGRLLDTWVEQTAAPTEEAPLTGEEDDPMLIEPIYLSPGQKRDDVNIVTNTGALSAGAVAGGSGLIFRLVNEGMPQTQFLHSCGALADVDLDGDLDLVVCGVVGGEDPVASSLNRLYENRQRINPDGSITYYFVDVTYGPDGVPNTADDRLPGPAEQTVGVAVGDFDLDGDPDIYFANRNAPSRLYINIGFPGHLDIVGTFQDVTPNWLLGLLNRASPSDSGFVDGGLTNSLTWDYPSRVVTGDIDADGDLDLIVSQLTPFTDTKYNPDGSVKLEASHAMVEVGPRTDAQPAGDGRPNSSDDLWGGSLVWSERVLINMTNVPTYQQNESGETLHFQGNYFQDQTLGSDGRAGIITGNINPTTGRFRFNRTNITIPQARQLGFQVDRMPPVFPTMGSMNERTTQTDAINTRVTEVSPMAQNAIQPVLGAFFRDSSLDLISIRLGSSVSASDQTDPTIPIVSFQTGETFFNLEGSFSPGGGTGGDEQAFFRNTDVFSNLSGYFGEDGINDGYFACINYDMDWNVISSASTSGDPLAQAGLAFRSDPDLMVDVFETSRGAGLYVYEFNANAPDFIAFDAMPLYIGMPASSEANYTGDPPGSSVNADIVPAIAATGALSGALCDWFNSGSPLPLIGLVYNPSIPAPDGPVGIAPFTFANPGDPMGAGYSRSMASQGNVIGGIGNPYYSDYLSPVASFGSGAPWSRTDIPESGDLTDYSRGTALGIAHDDFDRDADEDFFIATSHSGMSVISETTDGWISPVESVNQLWINDSFGGFSEITASGIVPNEPAVSFYTVSGDIDNDGDPDLVVLNGAAPDQLYINETFTTPPNFESTRDKPLFYETSQRMFPPLAALQLGLSLATSVGDLDGDGRADVAIANGGIFTDAGDHFAVYFNRGSHQMNEGVIVFQPAGSDHPAPFLSNTVAESGGGLITTISQNSADKGIISQTAAAFFRDVIMGDVNNDGAQDLVSVATSFSNDPTGAVIDTGPLLFMNIDSDWQDINSIPDADSKGDGVFVLKSNAVPPLIDYENPYSEAITLKKQGRRARFADVNRDGYLDILVANGFQGAAAPNLLLLNDANPPNNTFTDRSDGDPIDGVGPPLLPLGPSSRAGVLDNTADVAAADFDGDSNIEIVFANQTNVATSVGFRYLNHAPEDPLTFVETTGHFLDADGNPTEFAGTQPQSIVLGDFDGVGEPTEDVNYNGHLDPGEDTNDNDQLDWTDLPSETEDLDGNGFIDGNEDLNHNGALDPGEDANDNGLLDFGEDVGVMGPDGEIVGANNGDVDEFDLNNDGVITVRRAEFWDGSVDLFVTFENDLDRILINDPTNRSAGTFRDRTETLFPGISVGGHSRGASVGDINHDGLPDIVVAQYIGGVVTPVKMWINTTIALPDGKVRRGVFVDRSYEVPPARAFGVEDVTIEGENPTLFLPWASDVDLLDIDGDGDLDMLITGLGQTDETVPEGAVEMVYINRLIGAGFQTETRVNVAPLVSPTVIQVNPRGSTRDVTMNVWVDGQNFDKDVRFSFGAGVQILSVNQVTAYDTEQLRLVDLKNPPPDLNWTKIATKGYRANVTIQVAADAPFGPRAVAVQNGNGGATLTKPGVFNVFENLSDAHPENRVPSSNWTLYR